jgi:hypothetical protein
MTNMLMEVEVREKLEDRIIICTRNIRVTNDTVNGQHISLSGERQSFLSLRALSFI